jgi:hypothetical protein
MYSCLKSDVSIYRLHLLSRYVSYLMISTAVQGLNAWNYSHSMSYTFSLKDQHIRADVKNTLPRSDTMQVRIEYFQSLLTGSGIIGGVVRSAGLRGHWSFF